MVDAWVGADFRNLDHTLSAAAVGVDLVAAELSDDNVITHVDLNAASFDGTVGDLPDLAADSDFRQIRAALGPALFDGDADLNGEVFTEDLATVRRNFGQAVDRWSKGDFDFDGEVFTADLAAARRNFGVGSGAPAAMSVAGASGPVAMTRAQEKQGRADARAARRKAGVAPATAARPAGTSLAAAADARLSATAADPGPDKLELVVNVLTGEMRLVGDDVDKAEFGVYGIRSVGNNMDPTKWNSLQDQAVPPGWSELIGTDGRVGENTNAVTGFSSADATGFTLGMLFDIGGAQDLVFSYADENNISVSNAPVSYVPEPSAVALIAAGALATLRRPRRRGA